MSHKGKWGCAYYFDKKDGKPENLYCKSCAQNLYADSGSIADCCSTFRSTDVKENAVCGNCKTKIVEYWTCCFNSNPNRNQACDKLADLS